MIWCQDYLLFSEHCMIFSTTTKLYDHRHFNHPHSLVETGLKPEQCCTKAIVIQSQDYTEDKIPISEINLLTFKQMEPQRYIYQLDLRNCHSFSWAYIKTTQ